MTEGREEEKSIASRRSFDFAQDDRRGRSQKKILDSSLRSEMTRKRRSIASRRSFDFAQDDRRGNDRRKKIRDSSLRSRVTRKRRSIASRRSFDFAQDDRRADGGRKEHRFGLAGILSRLRDIRQGSGSRRERKEHRFAEVLRLCSGRQKKTGRGTGGEAGLIFCRLWEVAGVEKKEHRFAEVPSAGLRTGSSTALRTTEKRFSFDAPVLRLHHVKSDTRALPRGD
jgi:hypothetical protein